MINKLYNYDLKLEYVNSQDIDESTKTTALYEFNNTSKLEREYGKDVYAFNDLEIKEFLKSLRSSSVISIRRSLSILNSYVKWCIVNGKRGKYENNINQVDAFIKTEDDLSKYVSNKQLSSKILSKEELDDIIHILVNPVDQAIIQCMYEFISGEKLYELRSLEFNNVDIAGRQVLLSNIDGEVRVQNISSKLVKILEETEKAPTYIYKNGLEDAKGNIGEREFPYSKYIIKKHREKNEKDDMISYNSVLTRLRNIRKFTGYNHITANSLRDTRVIHEIMDVMAERCIYSPDNAIYDEVIQRIYTQYGIKMSNMQMYSIKQKFNQLIDIKFF